MKTQVVYLIRAMSFQCPCTTVSSYKNYVEQKLSKLICVVLLLAVVNDTNKTTKSAIKTKSQHFQKSISQKLSQTVLKF